MDLRFDAKHSFARLLDAVEKRASGNGVGHRRTPAYRREHNRSLSRRRLAEPQSAI